MSPMVFKSKVGSDGILHVSLPMGPGGADRDVQITVEPIGPSELSPEEWRRGILDTAGKWRGELERAEQGECEQRDPLS